MASNLRPSVNLPIVQPYRMHCSQRYLDLTKQKLELTRLPREPQSMQRRWDLGVFKSELEPLIDHWSEEYDWRAQETYYNEHLPQFKVSINGLRLHFVHKRAASPTAVPLLFIHGWPESFISVARTIDALCSPVPPFPPADGYVQAFHVVAPSIPGSGFGDPTVEEANNMQATAAFFDMLMKSLGYMQYIVHGSGWAFKICRMLALRHGDSCMAIHTVNPDIPAPRSGFGYTPEDMPVPGLAVQTPAFGLPLTPTLPPEVLGRPQTTAYALCDSPAGLLAHILDAVKPPVYGEDQSAQSVESSSTHHSPLIARSPNSQYSLGTPSMGTPVQGRSPQPQRSPQHLEFMDLQNPWTPTALIDWTMIYWLPGPEVTLRWLTNSSAIEGILWTSHSNVPLGITHFREPSISGTGTGQTPPQWAEAYHRVAMVRRREGRVRFPAWERPAEVVMDIRELAGILGTTSHVDPELVSDPIELRS